MVPSRLVFAFSLFLLLGGALLYGLFFTPAYLVASALVWGMAVLLVWAIKPRLGWFHLLLLLMTLWYGLSCLWAVDLERALLEACRFSLMFPISLLLSVMDKASIRRLYEGFPWVGGLLVVVGVGLQLYREGRLESTLGYANVLAMMLLVCLLVTVLIYLERNSNWGLIHMALLAAGILLTFSRSVWVIWLVAAFVFLLLFPKLRNPKVFGWVFLSHVAGLVLAMLVKRDPVFFLNRLSSIQTHASEFQIRLVYWKDSLAMLRDFHWLGTGGGGWSVLQQAYQSQEYYVKFIHNHYLQIALDIGWIGFIFFLLWIGYYYFSAIPLWKQGGVWEKGLPVIVGFVLLHAGFDFDLTFPWYFAVMLILMTGSLLQRSEWFTIRVDFRMMAIIAVCVSVIMGWMSAGYILKSLGADQRIAGKLESSVRRLSAAEAVIPWSHTIRYELAKTYVEQGNLEQDYDFYKQAMTVLDEAIDRLPEEQLYTDLRHDLEEIVVPQ